MLFSQTISANIDDGVTNPVTHYHQKKISLIFDGGPSIQTFRILDILKVANIRATFFVTGQNTKKYPDIIYRIVKDGHTIGIRVPFETESDYSTQKVFNEIISTSNAIYRLSGIDPVLIMPSNDNYKAHRLLKNFHTKGYTIVTYDLSLENLHKEYVRDTTLKRIRNYLIVCQSELTTNGIADKAAHQNDLLPVLPQLIKVLKSNKFVFIDVQSITQTKLKGQKRNK